jgi:predicted dehydrogenase/threonine dehydrogenase-like Zn-dependent dehydrogenase
MLQGIIKKGKVFGEEVPAPMVSKGSVLIKVVHSCISAGTEIIGVKTSRKSLITRALEQPDNLKKVIDMARSNGIARAYEKVKGKIAGGQPTGYSVSGVVIGVGEGAVNFKIGDRVAAAGAGIANHAEYVNVPYNLVVKMPDELGFREASTITLGSIAMQATRRAGLSIGEFAVVIGTGILGLLSIQILRVSGIRIAGIDIDGQRLQIAAEVGAEVTINPSIEDPVKKIINWSNGFGADAVIFAAATKSSEPLSQAFQMCRKKGRLVLLGVSGMNIKREDIYAKELDFLISTSYGPGRYDTNYEGKGLDYPYPYVRWTENRNMVEYLRLVNEGSINLDRLISKNYPIENVTQAFESLDSSESNSLMVILDYGEPEYKKLLESKHHDRKVFLNNNPIKKDNINIALIGSGNFAVGIHLPNIRKLSDKYNLYAVLNKTGHKGKVVAEQYHANYVTTNYDDILSDKNVDLVFITTRHDSHSDLTLKALKAGKNVFVEKPLSINEDQLNSIITFFENSNNTPVLMVGFNRRFSRYANEIKKHTSKRINPLFIHYRINAGYIPLDHWAHENGGRIIGEACHIIDLITFLTGCEIRSISYEELSLKTEHFSSTDNKSFILKYKDGSVASIEYFSVGNKKFPKEYMEVHFDEKTIVLDDYKSIKGYGIKINEIKTKSGHKGQLEELERLYLTLIGKAPKWPIEFWDMIQTTKASLILQ